MPHGLDEITRLHSGQTLYLLKPSLNVKGNTVLTTNITLFHDCNFYLLIEMFLVFLSSVSYFKEYLNEIVSEDTQSTAQNRDFFFREQNIPVPKEVYLT